MKTPIPNYLEDMVNHTRNAFCDTLNNPQLWSESLARRTLERLGSQAFNIKDVQLIIKDYVSVLSETIRRGETI